MFGEECGVSLCDGGRVEVSPTWRYLVVVEGGWGE